MSSVKRGTLNISHGRVFQARVIDVVKGRCSVRLTNNGQVLRALAYSGGPLQAGDACQVSYESGTPTVMAIGRTQDEASTRNPIKTRVAIPDLASKPLTGDLGEGGGVQHGHFYILQIGEDGGVKAAWPADAGGVAGALAASVPGDLVTLPIGLQVTDSFTIPDGVSLAGFEWGRAQINGQLVCEGTSHLAHLAVDFTGDVDGDTAVRCTGADNVVVMDHFDIRVTAPAGTTCNCVSIEAADGLTQMWHCVLHAGYGEGVERAFYFSDPATQTLEFRDSHIFALNVANNYTPLKSLNSSFPDGANYGTPVYSDRAAENHTHDAADIAVDASGFSGNLGPGDTTVQAALETLDETGGAGDLADLGDTQLIEPYSGTFLGWEQTLGKWSNLPVDHDTNLVGLLGDGTYHLSSAQRSGLVGGSSTTLHKHKGLYVPVAATNLIDSAGNTWNSYVPSTGVYTFRPQDNSNLWPTDATAVEITVFAKWAAPTDAKYVAFRYTGSSVNEKLLWGQAAGIRAPLSGYVSLNANGYFDANVVGGTPDLVTVRITGYSI